MSVPKKYMYALLLLGFIVLFQQFYAYGVWFSIEDVHHETLALMFLTAGATVFLVRKYYNKIMWGKHVE